MFLPEREIEKIVKCNLQIVVEQLAKSTGPIAVLHNLRFVQLLKERFNSQYEVYYKYGKPLKEAFKKWTVDHIGAKLFFCFLKPSLYSMLDL